MCWKKTPKSQLLPEGIDPTWLTHLQKACDWTCLAIDQWWVTQSLLQARGHAQLNEDGLNAYTPTTSSIGKRGTTLSHFEVGCLVVSWGLRKRGCVRQREEEGRWRGNKFFFVCNHGICPGSNQSPVSWNKVLERMSGDAMIDSFTGTTATNASRASINPIPIGKVKLNAYEALPKSQNIPMLRVLVFFLSSFPQAPTQR